MDLAVGAKQVIVMMSLFTKAGAAKLVESCTYPVTALRCVDRVYTDVALFELTEHTVTVLETWGMSYAEICARVEVPPGHRRRRRALPLGPLPDGHPAGGERPWPDRPDDCCDAGRDLEREGCPWR